MDADRFTTLIHGCFLGDVTSDRKEVVARVLKAYGSVTQLFKKRSLSQPEQEDIARKLFLSHLLNSTFAEGTAFLSEPDKEPLTEKYSLESDAFYDLVHARTLWRFFIESMPLVGSDLACKMASSLASYVNESKDLLLEPFVLAGLALSVIVTARINDCDDKQKEGLNDLLVLVVKKMNSSLQLERRIAFSAFLLKVAVCEDECIPHCLKAHAEDSLSNRLSRFYSRNLREVSYVKAPQSMRAVLSENCKKALSNLSVMTWLEMMESDTKFVSTNFYVNFWNSDIVPTNLQYMTGHFLFECVREEQDQELLNMMKPLAKEYDPRVELTLEESSFEEIVRKANASTGWKLEAIVDFLMNNHLVQSLDSKEVLKLISDDALFASKYVGPLFKANELAGAASGETNVVLLEVFQKADFHERLAVLKTRISSRGVAADMRTSNFDFQFKDFLSKIVRDEKGGVKGLDGEVGEDKRNGFMVLLLQDPAETIRVLVNEAVTNKGKVELIADLLKLFDCVLLLTDGDNVSVFLTAVMANMNHALDENSHENLNRLLSLTLSSECELRREVLNGILGHILTVQDRDLIMPIRTVEVLFDLEESMSGKDEKIAVAVRSTCEVFTWSSSIEEKSVLFATLKSFCRKDGSYAELCRLCLKKPYSWSFSTNAKPVISSLAEFLFLDATDQSRFEPVVQDETPFLLTLGETIPLLFSSHWIKLLTNTSVEGFATFDEKTSAVMKAISLLVQSGVLEYEHFEMFSQAYVKVLHQQQDHLTTQQLYTCLERASALLDCLERNLNNDFETYATIFGRVLSSVASVVLDRRLAQVDEEFGKEALLRRTIGLVSLWPANMEAAGLVAVKIESTIKGS